MTMKKIIALAVILSIESLKGALSMTTSEMIQHAQELQYREPLKAITLLEQAIPLIDADEEEYEYLFAHYAIMTTLSRLGNPGDEQYSKAVVYAQKCMNILEPSIQAGSIMHFTDFGKFQEEVIRYATNAIGWNAYQTEDNKDKLEDSLQLVDLGISYANEDSLYIHDTKVRLLLKLNRKEEAYELIRSTLTEHPIFSDFDDLENDPAYIKWYTNKEADIVHNLTDEEKAFLEKASRVQQQIHKSLENWKVADPAKNTFQKSFMSYEEARKTYGTQQSSLRKGALVLVLQGDVHIDGDLNKTWFNNQIKDLPRNDNLNGLLIIGDLFVNGDILDEHYLKLAVTGSVWCDYLFSYDGSTEILKDLHTKYGMYGKYNDGYLWVNGKVNAPYIIAQDHDMPRSSDNLEFVYIEGGDEDEQDSLGIGKSKGSGWGWDWDYYENSEKLLSASVWDENREFSTQRFFEIVKNGENPFIEPEK